MGEPLKTALFNAEFFDALVAAFTQAYPAFDGATFLARLYDDQWDARELKERMRHGALVLHSVLPDDYRTALDIIRRASVNVPPGFGTMIFTDFVQVYGQDDWDASIPALEQLTTLCSAEYAVRPFILRDPPRMMAQMLAWTRHDNVHVRRLASEGCRPRLPWGMTLPPFQANPAPILPILEALKLDESEYVRRSVSNNLNDISKDNPQVVIEVARRWQAHDTPEMRDLIAHALRTLVKKGDPAALSLLGFGGSAACAVKNLAVEPAAIPMHGEITFSFEIESLSDEPQNLVIDYVIHLMRANGQHTPKVFKLSKRALAPGETITLTRKHRFAPVTTRRYYPGEHALEIQVNGARSERKTFTVQGE